MKYKVNDYLAHPETVCFRVVAAMDSSEEVLYAIIANNPFADKEMARTNDVRWVSEYMLDNLGIVPTTPDFEGYAKLRVGDVLQHALDLKDVTSTRCLKVLARVDDVVLLSILPRPREERQANRELSEQLDELVNDAGMPDNVAKIIKRKAIGFDETSALSQSLEALGMPSNALHVPGDRWIHVHDLALTNWKIVSDE